MVNWKYEKVAFVSGAVTSTVPSKMVGVKLSDEPARLMLLSMLRMWLPTYVVRPP